MNYDTFICWLAFIVAVLNLAVSIEKERDCLGWVMAACLALALLIARLHGKLLS